MKRSQTLVVKYPKSPLKLCRAIDGFLRFAFETMSAQSTLAPVALPAANSTEPGGGVVKSIPNDGNGANVPSTNGLNQQASVEGDGRAKKKSQFQGRGKGIGAVPKGRAPPAPGWTGAGFDS